MFIQFIKINGIGHCQKNKVSGQALVAYVYNPSYSGGRDQEGCGLKLAGANSS
jgi:hypothetical protein